MSESASDTEVSHPLPRGEEPFDMIIAMAPKWKKGVIRFGKWTMTEDMVADVHYGKYSFKEYIKESGWKVE